jgi:hypothetical protein
VAEHGFYESKSDEVPTIKKGQLINAHVCFLLYILWSETQTKAKAIKPADTNKAIPKLCPKRQAVLNHAFIGRNVDGNAGGTRATATNKCGLDVDHNVSSGSVQKKAWSNLVINSSKTPCDAHTPPSLLSTVGSRPSPPTTGTNSRGNC